jgi:hypothetical protein
LYIYLHIFIYIYVSVSILSTEKQTHRHTFELEWRLSPEVHIFLENFPHSTEESGDLCRIRMQGNNGRILFRRTDVICKDKGKGHPMIFLCRHRGKADLGARKGWVVSTTPRPLYPREILGTHCTGGWVGPRAGLDGHGKSTFHRDSIPGPSST